MFSLPNLFTLVNLFCGCLALVFVFSYKLNLVPYVIAIALAADFFDGIAARALKTPSNFGKQIDSLADMVTFGVVPAAVVFQLLYQFWETKGSKEIELLMLSSPAFFIALFAALRLAKFNIDARQTHSFIGLPTPAASIFVIGVLLIFLNNSFGLSAIILRPVFLYGTIVVLCSLMIAEIPMFSFKINFKKGWKGNEIQLVFIALVFIMAATVKLAAVPLSIVLYAVLSLIQSYYKNEI
jgi:CDP-diacylglycerol--serine O-phosphatidyltransferase